MISLGFSLVILHVKKKWWGKQQELGYENKKSVIILIRCLLHIIRPQKQGIWLKKKKKTKQNLENSAAPWK